jgi:hypothetical protein
MLGDKNPWEIPEWHAIGREASLVRHLVGSGATALGRANYADQIGEYYTAFFGLSVGFERLAKLILVVDYSVSNGGSMPEEKIVRKFGHNLVDLMAASDGVATKYNLKLEYERPKTTITTQIVECLNAFADARRGRYANFGSLGDPNLSAEEPIGKWWDIVAESILQEHYHGKSAQTRVETQARMVDALMSPYAMVLHINETGDVMQDVLSASVRTGQTAIVQRLGRYYALTVARWLSEVFYSLASSACYTHGIDAFFGAWEYLQTYMVDDRFLKTRKVWPLR